MRRPFVIALCLVLFPVAALLVLFFLSDGTSVPSNIVDFHPSSFEAQIGEKVFYSIGNDLKFSNQITGQPQTLARGNIDDYLVAPDAKRIAVVVDKNLLIVDGEEGTVNKITPVDSIYKESKSLGEQFFRDSEFQWSKDSQSLYLIKDEYYESKGSQLYSKKGELWRYDLRSEKLQLVLKPFPAYDYFLGLQSGIYFSVPTEEGDLRLRYFDGQSAKDVGDIGAGVIYKEQLSSKFAESPFFSFSHRDFNGLYSGDANLRIEKKDASERAEVIVGGKPYLALSKGEGMKGAFYCDDLYWSSVLPGNRYFLLSVPYCGNFGGQLLLDTQNGQYMTLPKDTRVYLTLNTDQVPSYHISSGGILAF